MRPSIAWTYLVLGSALAVAASLESADDRVFAILIGAAAVAMVVGVVWNRPARRIIWLPIAAALAAWSIAAAVSPNAVTMTHASFTTFLENQAPAYALLLVAVVSLMRASGRVPLGRTDAAVAFAAAVVVVWPLALRPNLIPWSPAHVGNAAMVLVDLVVMTLLLRASFTPTGRVTSFRLLLGAMVMMAAGDVVNVTPGLAEPLATHLVRAGYGLECALAAAAALHPTMRDVPKTSPVTSDPSPRRTLMVLSSALFAPFAGMGLDEWLRHQADPITFGAVGAVLVSIALMKISRLLRQTGALRVAAEASEQKFRMMFDSAGIGISLGVNGMLTETNGTYQRMLGYTGEELAEMHYVDITHPDDVQLDAEVAAETAAGARESFILEKRYIRRDGSTFWVRVTVTRARDGTFDIGMIEDISERKRLETESERLLTRTVEVAEAERTALAADLHDGPIQHLTAVTLTLDLLANKLARGEAAGAATLAQQLRESVAGEMRSLRRLMGELRPPILEERGLEAALRDCADMVLSDEGVEFVLESSLRGHRLAPELETAVYRVVREALTNVRKHADATEVRVRLTARNGVVDLEIADDGVGFVPGGSNGEHVGVLTMRERIESVGGTWQLAAAPGEGTKIYATLPRKLRAGAAGTTLVPAG